MIAILSELGLPSLVAAPMNARAQMLHDAGRLDDAACAYEELLALQRQLGQAGYLSTTLIQYGDLRYSRGELDEAERLAVEGEALGDPRDVINFSKGRRLRAVVSADRGDDEAALSLAQSALGYATRCDFPAEHAGVYEALAHVHRQAGRTAEARAAYLEAEAIWLRYDWTVAAQRVRELLVEL